MHSFFKAEWKTIVAVVLFCGAIFGWFYHDEIVKSRPDPEAYTMTCMEPGHSFQNYQLNTPVSALNLEGFTKTTDEILHTETYKHAEGSLILNFRDGKLSSIEYYFPTDDKTEPCYADMKYWVSNHQEVAESLTENKRTHRIFEGIVLIQDTIAPPENTESSANSSSSDDSEDEEPSTNIKTTGFIILNA